VTGVFTVNERALLADPEGCERYVYLVFNEEHIEKLTPEGSRQLDAAAKTGGGLVDVVLVGRARTWQTATGDQFGELTVYAVESAGVGER
jgi:hypothetical protein